MMYDVENVCIWKAFTKLLNAIFKLWYSKCFNRQLLKFGFNFTIIRYQKYAHLSSEIIIKIWQHFKFSYKEFAYNYADN